MAGPQPWALGTGGAVTDPTTEDEAAAMVAAVRDHPARRLELAARFYDRRTGWASIRSYRRAELAFMHWQIRRGVLAAPGADRPGSPWWRAVNEGLLRDAWQAWLLVSGQPGTASRPSVAYVWTTAKAPLAIRTLRNLTRNTGTDQPGGARSAWV
jgi:hypothetical protein